MIRVFQRITTFLSTDFAAPLTLAVVCLAAYAPGIASMGFFWDDWVMNWIAQNLGNAGLATYFSTNRPVWGVLYQLTTPILGGSPLGWQILAILARLLTPHDFGLANAGLTIVGFAAIFSQLGLDRALIQRPELTPAHLRTRAFVESNRRLVEKLSNGQLAYVYLPNTGGTVFHLYMAEQISSPTACKNLVRRCLEKFRIPYLTITPTFSICPDHGYIAGGYEFCPKCDEMLLARKLAEKTGTEA